MSAPVTNTTAIPEDIMFAAEEALDNMCCNCVESCGGAAGFRKASIEEIARPIFAERQRSGSMTETYRNTINQQAEEIEALRTSTEKLRRMLAVNMAERDELRAKCAVFETRLIDMTKIATGAA